MYHQIDERYRKVLIENETAQMTVKDLGRYYLALDKALMKYHTDKMKEINQSISEMWKTVYRGSDIDYIVVRSDSEEDGVGAGAANPVAAPGDDAGADAATTRLSSYNYRVNMVCGDTELEMRGRCSAGQRVLASLIIRLALAESFCASCGILALDEPTTNLDAANARGLAEALAELVESRRGHRNFQLMLITHDEAFVDQLARLQVCDWYYQLRKSEAGNSFVERREMASLGA